MRHGSVSVDASSGVVVPQEDRSVEFSAGLDAELDCRVLEPMFDEAFEGWDVDLASCFAGTCDQWLVRSGVGSAWCSSFAFSPISAERQGVGDSCFVGFQDFGALPEAFDGDGGDVFVLVGDGPVGWVAPCPRVEVSAFCGVVLSAGVDDDAFDLVFDRGSHADGGEFPHADDWHSLLSRRSVGRVFAVGFRRQGIVAEI